MLVVLHPGEGGSSNLWPASERGASVSHAHVWKLRTPGTVSLGFVCLVQSGWRMWRQSVGGSEGWGPVKLGERT